MLDPERLEVLLVGSRLGREVKVYAETASTNDVAADHGKAGAAEGVVIFAERQTRGRGRQGRAWESEPGAALAFSLLLRPALPLGDWTRLTLGAAVAVAEACEEAGGVPAQIKWPNDIYLKGRKAAGILIETQKGTGERPFAVIGIGINVNQTRFPAPLEERATSLRLASRREQDREALAAAVILKLEALYAKMGTAFGEIIAAAAPRDFLFGRAVQCSGGAVQQGFAEGFDARGGLRLRLAGGAIEVICGGEVSVRPS